MGLLFAQCEGTELLVGGVWLLLCNLYADPGSPSGSGTVISRQLI